MEFDDSVSHGSTLDTLSTSTAQTRNSDAVTDLLTKLKDSPEHGFPTFRKRLLPSLASRLLSQGLPRYEAEDLAESCISDIALQADKFRPDRGSLHSWISFHLLRLERDSKAWSHSALSAFADLIARQEASSVEEVDCVDSPQVNAVRDALRALSAQDRDILTLRVGGGYEGFDDIAKHLNVNVDAARTRHHRALKRLGRLLMEDPRILALLNRRGTQTQLS